MSKISKLKSIELNFLNYKNIRNVKQIFVNILIKAKQQLYIERKVKFMQIYFKTLKLNQ